MKSPIAVLVLLFCIPRLVMGALPVFPDVVPGYTMQFPRDFGAHPDYRIEWWYATGWLTAHDRKPLGFQVTFFRSRVNIDEVNPSTFSPRQLIFAHAALSDPAVGHLLHDQRIARTAFELAGAKENDTDTWVGGWRFTRTNEKYTAFVQGREFGLRLTLQPTQPVLLEGDKGFSRKGPLPIQASYYYSKPHLDVTGEIVRNGKTESVHGTAWLDHEWSTAYLAKEAAGWDWTGINLNNGGALMLFRIRRKNGEPLWAGGTLRQSDGSIITFHPGDIAFIPIKQWQSPHTNASYPVAMRVKANDLVLELHPLMDDQELDSRGSSGAVYWEGAVAALRDGKPVGRGYLELTGYFKPLNL